MAQYTGKVKSYHTIEFLPGNILLLNIFLLKMSLLQKVTYKQSNHIKK